ncbi:MAG TPA: HAD-IC family P-type ATPase, partial [Candidatus Saccharimonadales bacterium]
MASSPLLQYLRATPQDALSMASSTEAGLKDPEVAKRFAQYGPNTIKAKKFNVWKLLWRQIGGNPLVIVLGTATAISYVMGQHTSAYYIFGMILLSAGLGFWNEFAAERTVHDLLKRVSLTAVVMRDGRKQEVPVARLTMGDVVFLSPGSIVPADVRLLESENLEVDQAALTGESKTVYKVAKALTDTPKGLNDYANIAFMSTTVTSGFGKGVVIALGKDTEFGKIAHEASFVKPETEFQKGLRRFGNLIIKVILWLTIGIFAINFFLGHAMIESLLFALAIAVGLTPELLPIIVTISLSHGAGKLAKKHVICKQLIAIENLGNMDVLCTDKTGTLTEGRIVVTGTIGPDGRPKPELITAGVLCNSAIHHHKILGNAIDVALWEEADAKHLRPEYGIKKVFEEPFDYERRAMFCVTEQNGKRTLIVKGSPDVVLTQCSHDARLEHARKKVLELNASGLRLVAIATKRVGPKPDYTWDDMKGVEFEGFITFLDIPKKNVAGSIRKMER